MKVIRIFLGTIAGVALASNVYAANKTHVTDTLGAGNSEIDISYCVSSDSLQGTVVLAGGSSYSDDYKIVSSGLCTAYYLGVTDRLDIAIGLPLSKSKKYTDEYTIGVNRYNVTSKVEGLGDVIIGATYLILDKQQNNLGWDLFGAISPSTAPSDPATSEIVTNGTITQAGKDGQSGNGYMTTTIASAISIPIGIGDFFLAAHLNNYGERTRTGVIYKRGSHTSFSAGLENMVSEKITLTPYAKFNFNAASTYSNGTNIAANSGYDLGFKVTNDLSKNVSLQARLEYTVTNDIAVTYANGDKWNYSGKGYIFDLSAMFFF
ncbi:MAG: hypothetical protein HY016_10990 [Nitrosomonadales bacterium]|nr:hypothetical protein [Nitrosomonadales bacterium]